MIRLIDRDHDSLAELSSLVEELTSKYDKKIKAEKILQYLSSNFPTGRFYFYTVEDGKLADLILLPGNNIEASEVANLAENSLRSLEKRSEELDSELHYAYALHTAGEAFAVLGCIIDLQEEKRLGLEERLSSIAQILSVALAFRKQKDINETMIRAQSTVIDNIDNLIWTMDREGRYRTVNLAFLRTAKRSRPEIIGKKPEEVFGYHDGYQITKFIATVSKTLEPESIEYRNNTGMDYLFKVTAVPITGPDKKLLYISCFAQDITENMELRRSNNELNQGMISIASTVFQSSEMDGTRHLLIMQEAATMISSVLASSTAAIDAEFNTALRLAASIHDIGMARVPVEVVLKPSSLDKTQRELIRPHPEEGLEILEDLAKQAVFPEFLYNVSSEVILYHHENYDGSGYPYGLKGEEIPLSARIISICDAYSAMCCKRPHREAFSHVRALEEIEREAGRFDPRVLEAFFDIEGQIELAVHRISEETRNHRSSQSGLNK